MITSYNFITLSNILPILDLEQISPKNQTDLFYAVRSNSEILQTKRNYSLIKKFSELPKEILSKVKNISSIAKVLSVSPFLLYNKLKSLCKSVSKEDVLLCTKNDSIYTEWGRKIQSARGKFIEQKISEALNSKGVPFLTEEDLRGASITPDFLFKERLVYNHKKIYWIEAKAYFGNKYSYKKELLQSEKYTAAFGPGLLIYWYGHNISDNENFITRKHFLDFIK